MEYFKAEETQDGIAVAVLEKTFFNAEDFFRGNALEQNTT